MKGGISGLQPDEGSGGYACDLCGAVLPLDPDAMLAHCCSPAKPVGGCYTVESPWTWREKLRAKLYPLGYCKLPEAPATHKDVLTIQTFATFDWLDRLRILVSGRVRLDTQTVTENMVGDCKTESIAYPLPPVRFERGFHAG